MGMSHSVTRKLAAKRIDNSSCQDRVAPHRRGRSGTYPFRFALAAQLAFNVTMHPEASPGSQGTACKLSPAMQSTEPQAAESLQSLVCEEPRRLATHKLAQEPSRQSLQATALEHEAGFRLSAQDNRTSANRTHFFAVAAEAMGRMVIDRARRRRAVRWTDATSYGPDLALANDLMDQSERQVVLTLFEKRRRFWKIGQDRISQWTRLSEHENNMMHKRLNTGTPATDGSPGTGEHPRPRLTATASGVGAPPHPTAAPRRCAPVQAWLVLATTLLAAFLTGCSGEPDYRPDFHLDFVHQDHVIRWQGPLQA